MIKRIKILATLLMLCGTPLLQADEPTALWLSANSPSYDINDTVSTRTHRIRHQSKISWKLSNSFFSSFAIAGEVFFEEDKDKITANRFYPVMLGANHGDSFKGSYFLLYQSKRVGPTNQWSGRIHPWSGVELLIGTHEERRHRGV